MKKAYKVIPCELFEVDRLIPWLEEQAQNGLFLEHYSLQGLGRFRKGEGESLRYWVHTELDGCPVDQETLQAYEERGWRRVAYGNQSRFHIFAAEWDAPLPWDLEHGALESYLTKQKKSALLGMIAVIVLFPIGCFFVLRDNWLIMWQYGNCSKLTVLLQGCLYIWLLATAMRQFVLHWRMHRRVQAGCLLDLNGTATPVLYFPRVIWWWGGILFISASLSLLASLFTLIL